MLSNLIVPGTIEVELKKVKITLQQHSAGKKFYLFPTPEALYVWLCALENNEQINIPDIEELVLEPDGFIEAELRGFEYSYEGASRSPRRLDLVRLGKAQSPKNSSGTLVTIHKGWVSGGLLPMKTYFDSDIDVRLLDEKDCKIDLGALFNDHMADD